MIIYGRLSHYRLIDAYQRRFSGKYWRYNRREIQIEPEAQQDSDRIFKTEACMLGPFWAGTFPIVLKLPPKVEEGKGRKVCVCIFMCFTRGKNSKPKAYCRKPEDDNDIQRFVLRVCSAYILSNQQVTEDKFLWSHLIFTKGCDKK